MFLNKILLGYQKTNCWKWTIYVLITIKITELRKQTLINVFYGCKTFLSFGYPICSEFLDWNFMYMFLSIVIRNTTFIGFMLNKNNWLFLLLYVKNSFCFALRQPDQMYRYNLFCFLTRFSFWIARQKTEIFDYKTLAHVVTDMKAFLNFYNIAREIERENEQGRGRTRQGKNNEKESTAKLNSWSKLQEQNLYKNSSKIYLLKHSWKKQASSIFCFFVCSYRWWKEWYILLP